MRPREWACLVAALLMLPGCATAPTDPVALAAYKANHDPLEPLNRKVFAFNEVIDTVLLKPIAKAYLWIVPRAGRDGLRNILSNLSETAVMANDALQGEGRRARITASRFLMNSTLGVVGISDFAGRHGFEKQTGDFGQTLHVWGLPEGPYLILPLWGPTNPRDAVGSGVDTYLDPLRYVVRRYNYPSGLSAARVVGFGIDERSRSIDALDELKRESIDYYASFRSLYRQHRAADVDRTSTRAAPADDFYSDPGAPAGAAAKQGSP